MAGLFYAAGSGEVALVAATAKSVIQIKTPANQRAYVQKIKIMGKAAAGGTDTPIKCRITRNSANFGTFSAGTTGKLNPSNAETIQCTIGANASAEPTTPTDTGDWYEVNPQTGVIDDLPPGKFWEIPGGQSLQIELTSTGTPTVQVTAVVEE